MYRLVHTGKDDYAFSTPFRSWIEISKIDKDNHVIGGYASVEKIDTQGDLIPLSALKEAWTLFISNMDYAHVQVMHSNVTIGKVLLEYRDSEGKLWKSGVDDVGLFILVEIRQDIKKGKEVWQLILEKKLSAFSIGGEALVKVPVVDGIAHQRIEKLELHEISVVTRPANEASLFNIIKSNTFAKIRNMIDFLPDSVSISRKELEKEIILKPIPKPKAKEERSKYISRCVSRLHSIDSDRPNKQIVAICMSTWRSSKKGKAIESPLADAMNRIVANHVYEKLESEGTLALWKAQGWDDKIPVVNLIGMYDILLLRSEDTSELLTEEQEKGDVVPDPLDQTSISESKVKNKSETNMTDENTDVETNESESQDETEQTKLLASMSKELDELKQKVADLEKVKEDSTETEDVSDDSVDEDSADSSVDNGSPNQAGAKAKGNESEQKKLLLSSSAPRSSANESIPQKEKVEEESEEEETEETSDEVDIKSELEAKFEEYKKTLEKEFETKLAEAIKKVSGGSSKVKKTKTKQSTKGKDPLAMSLKDLHNVPFARIAKGDFQ